MRLNVAVVCILRAFLLSAPAGAQVAADLVAAPGIPANNAFAPHTPAGMVVIGSDIWFEDEAQGLRHYLPVDPNNTDPLNTGNLIFDTNPQFSAGGGSSVIWCSVAQVAQDGSSLAYLAVYDKPKGSRLTPVVGAFGNWSLKIRCNRTSAHLRDSRR